MPLEEDLVLKAAHGDRSAFEAVIGPMLDQAHRLAVGLLDNTDEAEDAVQEATVKAWRKLHRLRTGAKLRPWFLAIVSNQCREMRRSRWRTVLPLLGARAVTTADQDTDQHVDVIHALARLRPRDREAIVLHYYLDLPMSEVASVTHSSVAATKSRIYRALKTMKPALESMEALR